MGSVYGWEGEHDADGRRIRTIADGAVVPIQRLEVLPLADALTRAWPTDAQMVCHDGGMRVNSAGLSALRAAGDDLRFGALMVDVDAPTKGDGASAEWRQHHAELRAGLPDDLRAGMGGYATRGGYRLCWTLAEPVNAEAFEDLLFRVLFTLADHGVWADSACNGWTHLYRLPLVVRDGQRQNRAMNLERLGAAPLPALSRPAPLPTFERDTHHERPKAGHRAQWPTTGADGSAYGLSALEQECDNLASTGGGRNDALNRTAFAVAQLVAGGELGAGYAERCVLEAAESAAHNTGDGTEWLARGGRRQIRATFDSGWRRGLAEPRSASNDGDQTSHQNRRVAAASASDPTTARGASVPRVSERLWTLLAGACELTVPVRELLASEGIDPAVALALGCRDPWPVRAELHALLAGASRIELMIGAGLLDPRGGSVWRQLRAVCEGDTATRGLLVPVWWPGQSAPRRWFWWPGTTAVASPTPAPGVFGSALSDDDNTGPLVLVETVRDWLRVASAIAGAGLSARVVGLERRLSKLPAPVAAAVETAPLTVALGPEAGDSWRALTDAIEGMPRQGAIRWGRYTTAPGDRDGLAPGAVDLLLRAGGD